MMFDKSVICIIGLGYVGLPLAFYFSKIFEVVGYDINIERISELNDANDFNGEIQSEDLQESLDDKLSITNSLESLKKVDIYIITVPTPINESSQPDLQPLINASEVVGEVISKGNMVIYESTVFPGATEETCIPIVQEISGLKKAKVFI